MIGLLTKYWKLILDILLVVALVVAVFLWNPFNLFGKEVKLETTANVARQIKQIGQLVTAEYYGEVVASLGEAKLNFLKEDFLNEQADSIFVALKADVYDAYMQLVIAPTEKYSRKNQRERKKKKARKKALEYLLANYGKNLNGQKMPDTYVNDTLDIVLFFVAEKVLDTRTGIDLKKLSKDRKRERLRKEQLENLLTTIENKHLTLTESEMDAYLRAPLGRTPSFSSFYYTLNQQDDKKKDQLAMIGRGSVKAGFDFGTFEESSLYRDESSGTIHIFGLEPVILDFDINPWFIPQKAVPGYDIIQAGRRVSFDDAKKVKSYCRAKLRRRALEAGIIAEAQKYGEEVIKTFLSLVLGTEVKNVVFHENMAKVFFNQITRDGIIHHTELKLIASAEAQFLQKIETAKSGTLKKAYGQQLAHLLYSLRAFPLQLVDSSQVPFNFYTKELYAFLSDSTSSDTSIKPGDFVQIDTTYRWGFDTGTFTPPLFYAHAHWFYDSLGPVPQQFIKDYNAMLPHIHYDGKKDSLTHPEQWKYVCIPPAAVLDSVAKADTLLYDQLIKNTCTLSRPLSSRQKDDLATIKAYLLNRQRHYAKKSWVYKMREEWAPTEQAQAVRSRLREKVQLK